MFRSLSLMTALALVAGLSAGGAASAATPCRDAQGHFTKCSAATPAKPEKCRDAKATTVAKTPPAAKAPTT